MASRTDQEFGSPTPPSATRPGGRRPWFQFRLRTLLAITFLASILSLVMSGLLREGLDPQKNPRLVAFIVAAIAAPLAIMMLASFARPISELVKKLLARRLAGRLAPIRAEHLPRRVRRAGAVAARLSSRRWQEMLSARLTASVRSENGGLSRGIGSEG